MLAAISTTILLRRSCALTGSAITSRSRRNSTRGPPSAPRIVSVLAGPGRTPPDFREPARPRLRDYSMAIANGMRRGQDKARSPRITRSDAATGYAEWIGIDDPAIGFANGCAGLHCDVLRCGRAEQARADCGDVGAGGGSV